MVTKIQLVQNGVCAIQVCPLQPLTPEGASSQRERAVASGGLCRSWPAHVVVHKCLSSLYKQWELNYRAQYASQVPLGFFFLPHATVHCFLSPFQLELTVSFR